ncbi:MAG: DMT family transporter [Leadbetterella sp.]|nr:DMT family transporter [Leadbetterella sp.]
MRNSIVKGYLFAAASAISFGFIPLFIIPLKRAGISMDVTLFYRFLFAAVMIGAYCLFAKSSLKIRRSDLPKLVIMGLLYAMSAEFLFLGYDAMSAGIASTVLYVYPLIVALILYFGFGEKISFWTGVSIALALLGVTFMSWEGETLRFNLWGTLIVLTSALAYALYMIVVNKGKLQASGVTVTFYSVLFSAVFYALKTLVSGQSLLLASPGRLGFIAVFSLVTVVISVLFIVLAINRIGSAPTAILGALEPAVAVWVSVFFLGEKATWNLMAGLVLILSALLVNILGMRKNSG